MNKLFKRFAAISLSTMIAFGLISCGNNAEKKIILQINHLKLEK